MTLAPRLRIAGSLVVIVGLFGACTSAGSTPSPAAASASPAATVASTSVATAGPTSAATAATPTVAPTPTATPPAASSVAGSASPAAAATPPLQTDTAWGRIWDGVPPSFPVMPGAEPTTIGGTPASAVLQLPTDVANAAKWFQTALPAAGFVIDAMNGPIEDGSIVIDVHGTAAGCLAQVKIAPLGGKTVATVLVGASCPFQ